MKSAPLLADIYIEGSEAKMGNKKNKIWEVIIVNGIKYVKDAINSKLIASQMALKGKTVNTVSFKTLMKTSTGFII
ncbi:hypothetical protein ACFL4F_00925 [Candidatus Margulisiibacteriota bacterium]